MFYNVGMASTFEHLKAGAKRIAQIGGRVLVYGGKRVHDCSLERLNYVARAVVGLGLDQKLERVVEETAVK